MLYRFLVTGLMIALLAACGGNGDNGANGADGTNGDDGTPEEEVADERRPFMVSLTGAVEEEFEGGFFAACDREHMMFTPGEYEYMVTSIAEPDYLLHLVVPQGVLEAGTGTYNVSDQAAEGEPSLNEVHVEFEIDEEGYTVTDGEVTVEALPASPGDLLMVSVSAQASHTELGDVNIDASLHIPVRNENVLANCFGS